MQQTEKYQFNLIEREDAFSPDALNENMEKVAAQFDAVRAEAAADNAASAAADEALNQRVTVLEQPRFTYGTYTGHIEGVKRTQEIYLPFQPKVVLFFLPAGNYLYMMGEMFAATAHGGIIPGGFQVIHDPPSAALLNYTDRQYYYVAFG